MELSNSLTIIYPDKTISLLCPPRSTIKVIRGAFVELQSLWVEYGFSTADLIADDRAWQMMGNIANLFPRKENPAILGFDLEPLQTDMPQLEELFLTRDRSDIYAYKSDDSLVVNFYIDVFKGCKILEFCRFEPRMVVQDAHALWLERKAKVEKSAEVAEINPAKQRKAS